MTNQPTSDLSAENLKEIRGTLIKHFRMLKKFEAEATSEMIDDLNAIDQKFFKNKDLENSDIPRAFDRHICAYVRDIPLILEKMIPENQEIILPLVKIKLKNLMEGVRRSLKSFPVGSEKENLPPSRGIEGK